MDARVTESAAVQLGRLAARAAGDDGEIRSVDDLSDFARLTTRALEYRCEAAGMKAREIVSFVQCLRAVLRTDGRSWDPAACVASSDGRTVKKILKNAGLWELPRPTLSEFIERQALYNNSSFKATVTSALRRTGEEPPQSQP